MPNSARTDTSFQQPYSDSEELLAERKEILFTKPTSRVATHVPEQTNVRKV